MKGLLLKDFYNLRTEYLTYVILLVLTAGTMIFTSYGRPVLVVTLRYLPLYFGFAVTGLMLNSFSYDEKCGYMKYALATPVSRKTYLLEKYVFLLIHGVAGMLLGVLCSVVLTFAFSHVLTAGSVGLTAGVAGVCFVVITAMGCWQIALSVRFDAAKARLLYWAMFIGLSLLSSLGSGFGLFMFEEGIPAVAVIFAAGLLVFTTWMFCMSFIWMKRKEF